MSPSVEEIRRAAETRMRELGPVIKEIAQLQRILQVTEEEPRGDIALALAEADVAGGDALPVPGPDDSSIKPRRGPDGRAVRGSNKSVIMKLVHENPGIAAPEIAALTDLKREVVSATIYRLKKQKALEEFGEGVRVAVAPAKKRRFILELAETKPGITVPELADVAGLDPVVALVTVDHMVDREEVVIEDGGLRVP